MPSIGIKGGYAWDEARAYVQYNHVFEAKITFKIDKKDEEENIKVIENINNILNIKAIIL